MENTGQEIAKTGKTEVYSKKGGRGKGFTLETPIVRDLMYFDAFPSEVTGIKTQEEFLTQHDRSPQARSILNNYRNIPGYWEAVRKLQDEYQGRIITTATRGLLRNAVGSKIKKQIINQHTGNVETLETELPPETRACEVLHKIYGNLTDGPLIEVSGDRIAVLMQQNRDTARDVAPQASKQGSAAAAFQDETARQGTPRRGGGTDIK